MYIRIYIYIYIFLYIRLLLFIREHNSHKNTTTSALVPSLQPDRLKIQASTPTAMVTGLVDLAIRETDDQSEGRSEQITSFTSQHAGDIQDTLCQRTWKSSPGQHPQEIHHSIFSKVCFEIMNLDLNHRITTRNKQRVFGWGT